jgi:hypothetical protein
MNETTEGRDGYILAMGRKIYHVYKQDFPMEFWYGLTPDANREDSPGLIDVRSLPEKYQHKPVTVDWLRISRRSIQKAMRDQIKAHSLAFACALADGYSLEDHVVREEASELAESEARKRDREERVKAGGCVTCGKPDPKIDQWGECPPCAEIPF